MKLTDITIGIISANREDMLLSLLRSLPGLKHRCKILLIENSGNMSASQEFEDALAFLEYVGFEVGCTWQKQGQTMFQLRQQLLERCPTRYMWMIDDDVALVGDPLDTFLQMQRGLPDAIISGNFGYLQGSKIDIRNTEGYDDWQIAATSISLAVGNIPRWFYDYSTLVIADTCVMDCGNVFLDVKRALEVRGFKVPKVLDKQEYTGEDVLMGARLASNYCCLFASNLKVYHFPKSKMRFKTKDPRWLLNSKVDLGISEEIKERLDAFYGSKFGD